MPCHRTSISIATSPSLLPKILTSICWLLITSRGTPKGDEHTQKMDTHSKEEKNEKKEEEKSANTVAAANCVPFVHARCFPARATMVPHVPAVLKEGK